MASVPASPRHPAKRLTMLVGGVMLIIAAALALPLPVPAGIFLFAGGMVLILRTSFWARMRWGRAKRRWPRIGDRIDRTMRRPSALRRRERRKSQGHHMGRIR